MHQFSVFGLTNGAAEAIYKLFETAVIVIFTPDQRDGVKFIHGIGFDILFEKGGISGVQAFPKNRRCDSYPVTGGNFEAKTIH